MSAVRCSRLSSLSTVPSIPPVQVLRNGLCVDGRMHFFMGFSNSKLAEKSCFLFRCESTEDALRTLEKDWGRFDKIRSVAKRSKRIALLFSSVRAVDLKRKRRTPVSEGEAKSDRGFASGGRPEGITEVASAPVKVEADWGSPPVSQKGAEASNDQAETSQRNVVSKAKNIIKCEKIDDIEDEGFNFTDGCGFSSVSFTDRVARQKVPSFRGQKYVPSVLQIRYR